MSRLRSFILHGRRRGSSYRATWTPTRPGISVLLAASLFYGVLVLTGCHKQASSAPEVKMEISISPTPPKVGRATITLTFTAKDDTPLKGGKVDVEGDMAHAGMTPVFGNGKELQPGRYQAPIDFTMAGDWVLVVTAKFPGGIDLERQVAVRGVGGK